MALNAYVNTIIFNIFVLVVCFISICISRSSLLTSSYSKNENNYRSGSSCFVDSAFIKFVNTNSNITNSKTNNNNNNSNNDNNDNSKISLTFEQKYEVFALLISTCVLLILQAFVSIEIIIRIGNQPRINAGRIGFGAILGFLAHIGTIVAYPDAGLNHVICCIPCPTFKGCNPIVSGNIISAIILCATHFIIHFWEIHIIDTAAAFILIGLTTRTILPLGFYTLNVILQKVPDYIIDELDKCLKEALNIDGVLEFRNEKFWFQSFGKLAGSLSVRIRRNANESYVINKVTKHLSKIVSSLKVEEFNDTRFGNAANFNADYNNSLEYYIDEILPRDSKIDEDVREWSTDGNVKVMKINEVLGNGFNFNFGVKVSFENNSDNGNNSISNSRSLRDGTRPRIRDENCCLGHEKSFFNNNNDDYNDGLMTLYRNENVKVIDHLHRDRKVDF
ncbi:zinc transporter 6-A-like [Microplitis demolitor]|uniref:zinc transporter 6-A-like n=1 Tax=Microplitis demolitor TaxID=69319 RepID=UPI0004CCAF7D|nr:zinc transporter 6-A-like [Microplitis demolitor]